MSELITRFDNILGESIASVEQLNSQNIGLNDEVQELQNENIALRSRLKTALTLVDATMKKWVHNEKNNVSDFISASRLQAAVAEVSTLSVSNLELQRENTIFKAEVDKLNAQLRVQAMQLQQKQQKK